MAVQKSIKVYEMLKIKKLENQNSEREKNYKNLRNIKVQEKTSKLTITSFSWNTI